MKVSRFEKNKHLNEIDNVVSAFLKKLEIKHKGNVYIKYIFKWLGNKYEYQASYKYIKNNSINKRVVSLLDVLKAFNTSLDKLQDKE